MISTSGSIGPAQAEGLPKLQMSVERAREVWGSKQLSVARRDNHVLHTSQENRITLAGNFTADQLEAMAVLIRAGEI